MSDLPAVTSDDDAAALAALGADTGLEDFDTTDYVMPRLRIIGPDAVFEDQQTKQRYEEMNVILLGLVKQRILWDVEVNEGDQPLCKSPDNRNGFPDETNFPWAASGLTKQDAPLSCEACALTEWGSHPRNDTPWCTEQHTFPLLQVLEDGNTAPALLTVQRSAIKASRAYLSSFARSQTPTFTVVTKLGLTPQKRGSVQYAVPTFTRLENSNRDEWGFYAQQYKSIREYLTSAPMKKDDDDAVEAKASTKTSAAPAVEDDDDVPF